MKTMNKELKRAKEITDWVKKQHPWITGTCEINTEVYGMVALAHDTGKYETLLLTCGPMLLLCISQWYINQEEYWNCARIQDSIEWINSNSNMSIPKSLHDDIEEWKTIPVSKILGAIKWIDECVECNQK